MNRVKLKKFFERHRINEKKLAAGIANKPKGRPPKEGNALPPSVQQLSKVTQLQYELAMKERANKEIRDGKRLCRDFLIAHRRK